MIEQSSNKHAATSRESGAKTPSLMKQWASFVSRLYLERNDATSWIANTPHGRRVVYATLINTKPAVYYQEGERMFATPAPWINPREIQTPPGMYVDPSWKTQD